MKLLHVLQITLIIGFCTAIRSEAQNARADQLFDRFEYAKAIPLYKRSADKNVEAMKKLADCYRMIKNYEEAEKYYGMLATKNYPDPKIFFYRAEALMYKGDYAEAKNQFNSYSLLNPSDQRAVQYVKICDELLSEKKNKAIYRVVNLDAVNSPYSDFAPVFYKGGLVFASEQMEDLLNFRENSWTGNPFVTLMFSKTTIAANDSLVFSVPQVFSRKFNGKGHVGPACFSSDRNEMIYSLVSMKAAAKKSASLPALYRATDKNSWNDAKKLSFCTEGSSFSHPSLSPDGKWLCFTSDMPGGLGGTDLWIVKREGEQWSAPQNAGPGINTPYNESFPYILNDTLLFFASEGHSGYGGLDIFSASQRQGKWGAAKNMLPPINSPADDFGILVKDDFSGYFTSNRKGGAGSDDLYAYYPSGVITNLAGKLLYSSKDNDGASGIRLWLISDHGTELESVVTDASGSFVFRNLPADRMYNIKVDESNARIMNHRKLYLCDQNNKVVRSIVKNENGFFIYENLPSDLSKLTPMFETDPSLGAFSIAGNFYAGEQRLPVKNTAVDLFDDKGTVLQSTLTNQFGSFVFMDIDSGKTFSILLADTDPKLKGQKIYFTNKSGKEIDVAVNTPFEFKILPTDKATLSLLRIEDGQLLMDVNGMLYLDKQGKERGSNTQVLLYNESGQLIDSTYTDIHGGFKFENIPADQNYIVRLKEDDPTLLKKEIFLAKSNGKLVGTLKSSDEKYFHYEVLPADEQSIAQIFFDDPWLKVAEMKSRKITDSLITIIENIYYDYQAWKMPSDARLIINKVIGIMKANTDISVNILSHTDSRGTDDFNMKLSQKRAGAVIAYMIAGGINKKRLKAIGKGETDLVNRCSNDVECTEEEHAQNRRTEFKVRGAGNK